MFRKVQAFLALSSRRKRLFLQAYCLLGAMRFAILTRSFKSLVAGLELHREAKEQPPLDDREMDIARQVGWAVRLASRYTPWKSTCLAQVLAAQRMLQQRGIAGGFYLGASTQAEEGSDQPMSAHAWLKCDDQFITGEPGHQRFTVVSTFSWS